MLEGCLRATALTIRTLSISIDQLAFSRSRARSNTFHAFSSTSSYQASKIKAKSKYGSAKMSCKSGDPNRTLRERQNAGGGSKHVNVTVRRSSTEVEVDVKTKPDLIHCDGELISLPGKVLKRCIHEANGSVELFRAVSQGA